MDTALLWVIFGGFLEPLWVIGLKKWNETKSILWGIFAIAFIFLSPACLAFAMDQGMNVGVAYSLWTGLGAVFTLVSGVILFKEKLDRMKILFVFVIVAGVAGLEMCTELGI
jgi:multidrug transporter EmrE-like cation transporter